MRLRIVFMGTPDFSVPTLAAILAAGHDVVATYSQPPRPAGRGMAETKSPVHRHAEGNGIPVLTPKSLRSSEAADAMKVFHADVAVVVAYGLLLPRAILDVPRAGCLNLHGSALPRWRGAAPIQRAVMAGDTQTAVMVMRMEEGLDTGPVCLADYVPIGPDQTAGQLHDELSARGAALMVRALAAIESGNLVETPQLDVGVTYARKIDKAEARIDFSQPASHVHNQIRGLSPYPGAFFEIATRGGVERVKVLQSLRADGVCGHRPGTAIDDHLTIACQTGAVRLVQLQRAGKKPMTAGDLLRGHPIPAGTVLS